MPRYPDKTNEMAIRKLSRHLPGYTRTPEPGSPLRVRYGKHLDSRILHPEYDGVGKAAEQCPPGAPVGGLKPLRRPGNEIHQTFEFLKKAIRDCWAPLRIPSDRCLSILDGSGVEPNRSGHLTTRAKAKTIAYLIPPDRLNGTRIQLLNTLADLALPCLLGILINFVVETVDKRVCDRGSGRGGQFECLRKQGSCIFLHTDHCNGPVPAKASPGAEFVLGPFKRGQQKGLAEWRTGAGPPYEELFIVRADAPEEETGALIEQMKTW